MVSSELSGSRRGGDVGCRLLETSRITSRQLYRKRGGGSQQPPEARIQRKLKTRVRPDCIRSKSQSQVRADHTACRCIYLGTWTWSKHFRKGRPLASRRHTGMLDTGLDWLLVLEKEEHTCLKPTYYDSR